jgi:hypothetical protein
MLCNIDARCLEVLLSFASVPSASYASYNSAQSSFAPYTSFKLALHYFTYSGICAWQ